MKKLFSILVVCLFTVALHAQDRVVTKFLGIPVDGTKAAMIQKLKAKGFKSIVGYPDVLEGEFNGKDVYVHVATNNNKVYRITVADKKRVGEADIKIRFNSLCSQFERNNRYRTYLPNQSLPDNEDISYEMTVKNKRYEAVFYQKESMSSETSYTDYMRPVWFKISEFGYNEYYIIMFYDNEYNRADGEDL